MKNQPLFESQRIQIQQSETETEISISGEIPSNQFTVLSVWLVAWTVSGIYIITEVFGEYPQEVKNFMIAWLAFWFYFEIKIGVAWMWRRKGRELITIEKGKARFQIEAAVGKKNFEFETAAIRDFHLTESKKGLFIKNYFDSFWVVGGESVGFFVAGKLYMFGRQLPPKDAEKLMKFVENQVKRNV
ncbi:MAG: hypothetical protein WED33_00655 [Bacteroidia bacterium]